MSNFKSLMSQLRVSKEEVQSKSKSKVKKKEKMLRLSKGNKYVVRLLPYLTADGKPMTVKESWYHYKDNTKYGCSYPSCPLCGNTKKALQRLVNVQLKKTTDENVFEGEYYILSLHTSLYDMLNKYEKDNSLSLFDIFGAGELTIEVDSKPSGYGNDIFTYDESSISDILLPISNEINNFSDEEIMSFLKEFTFDLDKEVASLPKFQSEIKESVVDYTKTNVVQEQIKEVEEVKEVEVKKEKKSLSKTLNDIKNSIDNEEDVSINVKKPLIEKEEVKKVEIKNPENESKKPVKENIVINSDSKTNIDSFVDDFLKDFD